jgi:hypothetical protein
MGFLLGLAASCQKFNERRLGGIPDDVDERRDRRCREELRDQGVENLLPRSFVVLLDVKREQARPEVDRRSDACAENEMSESPDPGVAVGGIVGLGQSRDPLSNVVQVGRQRQRLTTGNEVDDVGDFVKDGPSNADTNSRPEE